MEISNVAHISADRAKALPTQHRWCAIVVLRLGVWFFTSLEANAQILWGDSFKYDNGGINPTVATNDVGTVVEVLNGGFGVGPLWYRVGQRSGSAIQWGNSAKYDNGGLNPMVALTSDGTVVEVHNGGAGASPLWYRVGRVNGSRKQWGDSTKYDHGEVNPSVTTNGLRTIVGSESARFGIAWVRSADQRSNGAIALNTITVG